MNRWKDYYSILQVHYLAEPEVIQSAYKRLSKKYHPDVNRTNEAEEKMKLINEAYAVLNDSESRHQYHQKWLEKNNALQMINVVNNSVPVQNSSIDALTTIKEYFTSIMNENFVRAYGFLSSIDKKNISRNEFVRWQEAVLRVSCIGKFECKLFKNYENVTLGESKYQKAAEFIIKTTEKNKKTNKVYEDEFTKCVVWENDRWNIFLGYKHLKPLIYKFEYLAQSKAITSVVDHWTSIQLRTDALTGMPNLIGFMEKAEKEASRSKRYKKVFSIICFEIIQTGEIPEQIPDYWDILIKYTALLIEKNFRDIDIVGRWQEKGFIALLPETNLESAVKAAKKICRLIENNQVLQSSNEILVYAGVSQNACNYSVQDVYEQCRQKLYLAKKHADKRVIF